MNGDPATGVKPPEVFTENAETVPDPELEMKARLVVVGWFIMLLLLMLPHEANTNKHKEPATRGRTTEENNSMIRLERKDCGGITNSNLILLGPLTAYPIGFALRGG